MRSTLKQVIVSILSGEARLALKRHHPRVVAVTGSVGKTSTKDAIYTLLASIDHTRKSQKSFNSELGVPLTILGLPNAWSNVLGWLENMVEGMHVVLSGGYPKSLVLEVGADRPGDIRALAWLRPHIVVFTRFPDVPVHVEFFSSPEAVIEEKRELKHALRPGGVLIVNADDPHMHDEQVPRDRRILSYGFGDSATVRALSAAVAYEGAVPVGMVLAVRFQNEQLDLTVRGALGIHHTYPVLAALTVGIAEGVSFAHAVQSMSEHVPPPGRMRIVPGVHDSIILDDTYNASPVAVEAGLATLSGLSVHGRRIVVLGDMMELGEYSVDAHRAVGAQVAKTADIFISVGIRMAAAADAAHAKRRKGFHVEKVKDAREAGRLVQDIVRESDVVLVKGSQSMRMERVVEMLMAEPERASDLLVRQEVEWKRR